METFVSFSPKRDGADGKLFHSRRKNVRRKTVRSSITSAHRCVDQCLSTLLSRASSIFQILGHSTTHRRFLKTLLPRLIGSLLDSDSRTSRVGCNRRLPRLSTLCVTWCVRRAFAVFWVFDRLANVDGRPSFKGRKHWDMKGRKRGRTLCLLFHEFSTCRLATGCFGGRHNERVRDF